MSNITTAIKSYQDFDCMDCGINTSRIEEYYMVLQKLWEWATGKQSKGILCIGCLEGRIGRRLTQKDFIDCPVNNDNTTRKSERLLSRIGKERKKNKFKGE